MGAINAGVYGGVPSRKFLHCKAGGTITKGDVVQWSATADDGLTVLVAAANTIPVGIAQNTAATGGTVKVQTRGQGAVAITSTGTSTAVGDYLYAAANADVADIAIGSTADVDTVLGCVGFATVTTGATALPAATYVVTAPCSWWESGTINAGVQGGYPTKKYMTVKAGAAITKGQVVSWDTATAKDGITVIVAGVNTIPAGVAVETAASGDYFRVQTRGLGDVNLTTSNASAAGDMLYTAASGAVADVAVGSLTTDADPYFGCVGLALADDSGTTQTAGTYMVMCPCSWWDDESISAATIGTPSRKFLTCKAGSDGVTKGSIVGWSTLADDGITVVTFTETAGGLPVGVAVEAAAAGKDVKIQTKGLGIVDITTGGSAAADTALIADDNGVTAEVAMGDAANTHEPEQLIGLALDANTSTTLAAGDYILMCPMSWWD
jgi:hypothetical protein